MLLVLSLAFSGTASPGSPAARAAFEKVSVMQQSIQHGGDGGTIAEQLSPVFHWSVGGNKRAGSLIASHDDFQQFLGGGQWQLAHSQVVDDEKRHRICAAFAIRSCRTMRSRPAPSAIRIPISRYRAVARESSMFANVAACNQQQHEDRAGQRVEREAEWMATRSSML